MRGGRIGDNLGEEVEERDGKLRKKKRRRANKMNKGSVKFLEGDEVVVGGKRGKEETFKEGEGGEKGGEEGKG